MKIKVQQLTPDDFSPFGTYFNIYDIDKSKGGDFSYYPDITAALSDNSNYTGFSVCRINKRPMIVKAVEIHEHTEEVEVLFDSSCAVLVGERSGYSPDITKFRAFLVPPNTLLRFKKFVWHFVPYPVDGEKAMALTVLPPYTYTNDALVVELDKPIELEL